MFRDELSPLVPKVLRLRITRLTISYTVHCAPGTDRRRDIVKACKESGAKYGFRGDAQFGMDLPTKEIERFIGKLEVLSPRFHSLTGFRTQPKMSAKWKQLCLTFFRIHLRFSNHTLLFSL
jgi:hypothetical protein